MKEKFAKRLKIAMEKAEITQARLARTTKISPSSISDYLNGLYIPKQDKLTLLANALNVSPSWLGCVVEEDLTQVKNIIIPRAARVPLLGRIAAGRPIQADENIEDYFYIDKSFKVDFCLRVHGDSMIGANILDGDIAMIRQQPDVENGEIAAVIIDGEATLKKVYKQQDSLILSPCNDSYAPITVREDSNAYIAGKLVGVIHQY